MDPVIDHHTPQERQSAVTVNPLYLASIIFSVFIPEVF